MSKDYVSQLITVHRHREQKINTAALEVATALSRIGPELNSDENLEVIHAVTDNPTMLTNSYHNLYHTACMVMNCKAAGEWYMLSTIQQAHLIIAAWFHDFEHSGGAQPDFINIHVAIENMRRILSKAGVNSFDIYEIEKIITVTEYPFIRTPETVSQKIIRDCDLLQSLEPDWQDQIFCGLLLEIQNKNKDFTLDQFVNAQISFMENAAFYTEWFEQKKRLEWNNRMQLIKEVFHYV